MNVKSECEITEQNNTLSERIQPSYLYHSLLIGYHATQRVILLDPFTQSKVSQELN